MTKNQRSYYAFLRAIKSEKGLSHKRAQEVYRAYKREYGQPRGVDVKKHPRIVDRLINKIKPGPGGVPKRTIRSLGDWYTLEDFDFEDYYIEYNAGTDYGKE